MGTHDDRNYWWNAAAVAGGLALGVIGSRLLPPFVATANGPMRVKLGQDAFRKLENDHRLIQATPRGMADAADQSPAVRMKLLLLASMRWPRRMWSIRSCTTLRARPIRATSYISSTRR